MALHPTAEGFKLQNFRPVVHLAQMRPTERYKTRACDRMQLEQDSLRVDAFARVIVSLGEEVDQAALHPSGHRSTEEPGEEREGEGAGCASYCSGL